MKNLFVGTIFADDSPLQRQWLDLQLAYLKATTKDYDHVALVTTGTSDNYFSDRTKILVPDDKEAFFSVPHLQGLKSLLDLFKSERANYENFLFIDGDAFPIRKGWLGSLLCRMSPQQLYDNTGVALPNKKGRDYEIAIALRSENLETRLHASITFVKGTFIDNVDFANEIVGNDLAGNPECDIHLPTYQFKRRHMAFPLIRSNQYNVHPLACGIYYDSFYHHCCGSGRWFNLRAKEYYDRIMPPKDDLTLLTNQLFCSPDDFITKLAGWNSRNYGEVNDIFKR